MDSFDSFGLCESALEFQVQVELPDSDIVKQYQFHSRHTVDKIKSKIVSDNNDILKKTPSDYILTIDGERIEIDFVRFIISHPKITEVLASDPLVKVKLITKQSITNTVGGSTLFLTANTSNSHHYNKEIVTPSINLSEVKSSLEKSPIVSRLNGGKPMGTPTSSPELKQKKSKDSLLSSPLKDKEKEKKEKEKEKLEKEKEKEKIEKEKEKKKEEKEREKIEKKKSLDNISLEQMSASGLSSSTGSLKMPPPSPTTPEKPIGSPLKSFLHSLSSDKKKKQLSVDDLHYATIRNNNIIVTNQRPKTQEYALPSITLNNHLLGGSLSSTGSNSLNSSSSSIISAVSEEQENFTYLSDYSLINESKGFLVEPLKVYKSVTSPQKLEIDPSITEDNWYAKYFADCDHWNYIGEDDKIGAYILSIVKDVAATAALSMPEYTQSTGSLKSPITRHGSFLSSSGGFPKSEKEQSDKRVTFKALLRTKSGDQCKSVTVKGITGSFFNSSTTIKPPVKDILHEFSPDLSCKNIKSIKQNVPELIKELTKFEQNQKIKSFKFGVLYCGRNQTEEEDMFSNENGSEAFNEFLDFLGERVQLNGWKSYRGGLDVKNDSTGTQSIYQKYKGLEVMFHVSTLLPHSKLDRQQVDKKRHIGNDIVVLIFKEGNQTFDPKIMKSDFNHVFIVVQPVDKDHYKVSIGYKDGVPVSLPSQSSSTWAKSQEFKDFLYHKLINSECSSYQAPSFKIKIQRTRLTLLRDISNTFSD